MIELLVIVLVIILLIILLVIRRRIFVSLSRGLIMSGKRRHELKNIEGEVEKEIIRIKTRRPGKGSNKEIPIDVLLKRRKSGRKP